MHPAARRATGSTGDAALYNRGDRVGAAISMAPNLCAAAVAAASSHPAARVCA